MENKNPYANQDGKPKKGYAVEFLEWERKKETDKINSFPDEQKKKSLVALQNLHNKMNS
jgi:hypothetical protein